MNSKTTSVDVSMEDQERMGKENVFQQKENKAFDMELFDHDLKATPTTRHHQTGPMRYCN